MSQDWCSKFEGGVRLTIQVVPHARKSEITGIIGDALRVRLAAQPIEGRANEALIRFFAARLRVSVAAVELAHGHASKRKVVRISVPNLDPENVRIALLDKAWGTVQPGSGKESRTGS